jgi:hypothetical protein
MLLPDTVLQRLHVNLEALHEIISLVFRSQRRRYSNVEAPEALCHRIDDRSYLDELSPVIHAMRDVLVSPGHDVLMACHGLGTLR